jgi:transposase
MASRPPLQRQCDQTSVNKNICLWTDTSLGDYRPPRLVDRFMATNTQSAKMERHCLGKPSDPRRSGSDNRLFIEAVLWIVRTGSPWRDLPEAFGKRTTVFKRYPDWVKAHVFFRLFEACSDEPDMEYATVDAVIRRGKVYSMPIHTMRRNPPFPTFLHGRSPHIFGPIGCSRRPPGPYGRPRRRGPPDRRGRRPEGLSGDDRGGLSASRCSNLHRSSDPKLIQRYHGRFHRLRRQDRVDVRARHDAIRWILRPGKTGSLSSPSCAKSTAPQTDRTCPRGRARCGRRSSAFPSEPSSSNRRYAGSWLRPRLHCRDPGRGRTKTRQLWAYARDDRPWGRSDTPTVAYVYAPDRMAAQPVAHLTGFKGPPGRRLRRLSSARGQGRHDARLLLGAPAPPLL